MPELPEVETTRLRLAPRIEGAVIEAVRLGKALRWPLGCAPQALVGQTVHPLQRRGKYLWMPLDRGGLLLHLGMSGSLAFLDPDDARAAEPGPHDHFDLDTDRGVLRLHDPRRFGAVVWSPARDQGVAARLLAGLGPEPFDPAFGGAHLHGALRGRRIAIKPALLAGDVVVGAGNIYACEALFDAGIDPRTRCQRLSRPRCDRLAAALRATLAQAVDAGGSTLRDYRGPDGEDGGYQQQARVYGREGQPCGACGTPIRRIVQGQRSTFFCPRCQR
jgi:formamidopyrimidine-DNA glycosylase